MTKTWIAGNWKMNGLPNDIDQLTQINEAMKNTPFNCQLLLCVPAPLIADFAQNAAPTMMIGAQDCHPQKKGAHTGDISAELLQAVGAKAVIVGHSERRMDHGETSELVAQKALATQSEAMMPIICIGESLEERDAGKAIDVVTKQLADSLSAGVVDHDYIIAYEPIWAIGSGRVPSQDDIKAMHQALREKLIELDPKNGEMRPILYGGSVKPSNAEDILSIPHVNGALIGGASLKADDFLAIASAAK